MSHKSLKEEDIRKILNSWYDAIDATLAKYPDTDIYYNIEFNLKKGDNWKNIVNCFTRKQKLSNGKIVPIRDVIDHYGFDGCYIAMLEHARLICYFYDHLMNDYNPSVIFGEDIVLSNYGIFYNFDVCSRLNNKSSDDALKQLATDRSLFLSMLRSMIFTRDPKRNYYIDKFDEYIGKIKLDLKDIQPQNIEVENVSETGQDFLSNIENYKLMNSFSGNLLDGKISMSSDKGYNNNPYKGQEDACASIVKSPTCFLNIIADGVGGVEYGAESSKFLVEQITKWFNDLSPSVLNNWENLGMSLKNVLQDVDKYLYDKYKGSGATTVVLSITNDQQTLIANVGDSTAYSYDSKSDSLNMLTVLDSYSRGLSYEDARRNPKNNYITAGIGLGHSDVPHIKIIDNHGQTILLSSDGVTDLISEDTLLKYFRNGRIDSSKLVENAVFYPEVNGLRKVEDNVSAISFIAPGEEPAKNRGRRG